MYYMVLSIIGSSNLLPKYTKTYYIRVMYKVRKTQHQNPEFGHTQGEIQKKPAKKGRKTQHQNPEFGHTQGEMVLSCSISRCEIQ